MDPKIYPSLKDLPLYKFYKELDDYNRTNKVSDLCKNIIGNRYLNSSEYIKLCEKLSKILLSIDYIKSKHKKDADTTCSYLSYWLYDKLTQITSASRDIDTVHYALGEVYRSSQLPELWSECYYKYFNKCTKSEFEIIKKLHDYTEAFKDIQSIIHNNGVGTTQKVKDYCAFIADGVRQYNRIIQEYGDCDKSNYCHELIAFKESFDKIDLSSLNCKCKIPLPQPAEKGAANLVQWYRSSGYWSPGDSYEECSLKNNFLFGNFFGSNKLGRFWITLLGSVLIILFLYKVNKKCY
ncbi:hypothetical protein PCYB_003630 [Plasmodium cynomolgi strain B]|uniref:CYIR protein n=1 Tax=Plasmodium cynomolgi (strain B) TaxID=1120755 RepID=K6V022_PLACD|nr:hypothetical protein PCYB_003630 [Plasmodium cynomolgi strain B]GAB69614.1 hypothetical protein PCYB_003630 [Plasmodium cynomolgi strain B]